jgi:hypothetical protein
VAFDNPDHVAIVIDNYRWRLGLPEGEPQYDDLEKRLAQAPRIAVPTITLEGEANGAPHPEASAYAKMFSDKYAHRVITGGIGHNLPRLGYALSSHFARNSRMRFIVASGFSSITQ